MGLKYILLQLFVQYLLEDLYLCFNMLIQILKLRQVTNMKIQLVSTCRVLIVVCAMGLASVCDCGIS